MLKVYRFPSTLMLVLLGLLGVLVVVDVFVTIHQPTDEMDLAWLAPGIIAGLFLGGLVVVMVLLGRTQYFWVGSTRFGLRSRWPFREVDRDFRIIDYIGVDLESPEPVIQVAGGETLVVPRGMAEHMRYLDGVLQGRRYQLLNWSAEAHVPLVSEQPAQPARAPWPPALTFDRRCSHASVSEDGGEIKIDDPDLLRSLIRHYRAAAIFRESFPPAFDLVKIFIGLKRSNGGLVLIGVHPDGRVVGLPEEELADGRERLEHLAGELTAARVEIGRIELEGKFALFAVFNATASNLRPMDGLEKATSDVVIV